MLIKYEANVKDCFNGDIQQKCKLYQMKHGQWYCMIDDVPCNKQYPCQLRPCPIEVKKPELPDNYSFEVGV